MLTITLRSPEDIQKIKELEENIKKFEELPPLSNPEDLQKIKELEEKIKKFEELPPLVEDVQRIKELEEENKKLLSVLTLEVNRRSYSYTNPYYRYKQYFWGNK